jgi:uncharacterized membrane protein
VSISVGAVASIIVTYITRWHMTAEEEEAEWEKTRDIDNPLYPWIQVYKGELNLDDGENFHDRPPLEIVIRKFRAAKLTSIIAAIMFTLIFVVLWPGSMLSFDIMGFTGFNTWTQISRVWAFTAAIFIIILPFYQEVNAVKKQLKRNSLERESNNATTVPLTAIPSSPAHTSANGANGNATGNGNGRIVSTATESSQTKQVYLLKGVHRAVDRVINRLSKQ